MFVSNAPARLEPLATATAAASAMRTRCLLIWLSISGLVSIGSGAAGVVTAVETNVSSWFKAGELLEVAGRRMNLSKIELVRVLDEDMAVVVVLFPFDTSSVAFSSVNSGK